MQGVAAVNDMMRERIALRPVRRAAAFAPRGVAVAGVHMARPVGQSQQVALIVAKCVEGRVLVLGLHVYGGQSVRSANVVQFTLSAKRIGENFVIACAAANRN